MKFLKQQNLSKYSIADNTIFANNYGRVTIDAVGGLMLPKGTSSQRPQLTNVKQRTDANGTIRYNTTLNCLEAYILGVWEVVRAPGTQSIVKQTLGVGDGTQTVFGPLNQVPSHVDNILVFVENVFQISTTNFTLEQSDGTSVSLPGPTQPYVAGWYIKFTSAVPGIGLPVTVYFGYAN